MKRCLCAVFIFLFTIGCQNSTQPDMKPFSRLTYFDGPERYAGRDGTTFTNAADFFKKDSARYLKTRLFWNADGQAGSLDSPYGGTTCGIEWSPSLKAYVVLTFDGIYTFSPGDKSLKAVWLKGLLHPQWAFDRDKQNLLVQGFDVSQHKRFCAIVDLGRSQASLQYVDDHVTGKVFADAKTAVMTLPSGMVTARQNEAGAWEFARPDTRKPPGAIVGMLDAVPVYRAEDTITVGEHSVKFDGGVCVAKVANGRIFAVIAGGDVYRVDADWTPVKLGTISLKGLIGYGEYSEGFWLAISTDNKTVTVYTYGDSEQSFVLQVP